MPFGVAGKGFLCSLPLSVVYAFSNVVNLIVMGNTFNKYVEMYEDYCELCRLLKVTSMGMNADFRIHEELLLKRYNYPSTADAISALSVKVS